MTDFSTQRLNMVESQVRPSDVTDRRLLRAMGAVAREAFVPQAMRAVAYMDEAVALGGGRSLMPARTFAKLVQAADLPDGATVLDAGAGLGYATAVLARMARKVVALEPDAALADAARVALTAQGVTNATVVTGPIDMGSPAESPYDAIVLGGAVPDVPQGLLDQLKNGGKLVAIVIAPGHTGKAVVVTRSGQTFARREAFDAVAAPLPGFTRPRVFAL